MDHHPVARKIKVYLIYMTAQASLHAEHSAYSTLAFSTWLYLNQLSPPGTLEYGFDTTPRSHAMSVQWWLVFEVYALAL
jgi:hypothetical protein